MNIKVVNTFKITLEKEKDTPYIDIDELKNKYFNGYETITGECKAYLDIDSYFDEYNTD